VERAISGRVRPLIEVKKEKPRGFCRERLITACEPVPVNGAIKFDDTITGKNRMIVAPN
jgi:hypothetical protein